MGWHVSDSHVEMLVTRELRIETREPSPLFADGEPMDDAPATLRIEPDALRILADRPRSTV